MTAFDFNNPQSYPLFLEVEGMITTSSGNTSATTYEMAYKSQEDFEAALARITVSGQPLTLETAGAYFNVDDSNGYPVLSLTPEAAAITGASFTPTNVEPVNGGNSLSTAQPGTVPVSVEGNLEKVLFANVFDESIGRGRERRPFLESGEGIAIVNPANPEQALHLDSMDAYRALMTYVFVEPLPNNSELTYSTLSTIIYPHNIIPGESNNGVYYVVDTATMNVPVNQQNGVSALNTWDYAFEALGNGSVSIPGVEVIPTPEGSALTMENEVDPTTVSDRGCAFQEFRSAVGTQSVANVSWDDVSNAGIGGGNVKVREVA